MITMSITRLSIKKALINYANENNRPHYDVDFVKRFYVIVDLGLDHPIKNKILEMAYSLESGKAKQTPEQKLKDELFSFCNQYGMIKTLAQVAGVDVKYVRRALELDAEEVIEPYERLSPFFSEATIQLRKQGRIPHGTIEGFIKYKCKCLKCEKANALHSEKRNSNLELI